MKNKRNIISFFVLCFVFFLFVNIKPSFAQDSMGFEYANDLGLNNSDIQDPRIILVNIVKFFLSFVGLIAVSMIMWAGFLWMTSGGDPAKIDNAKKTLINAVIGLIIIISAFVIVLFVQKWVTNGLSGSGGSGGSDNPGSDSGLMATGNKAIESHYPESNQRDVPRNTMIVVTFKEPINASTVIEDTNSDGIYGNYTDTNGNGVLDDGDVYDKASSSIRLAQKDQMTTGPWIDNLFAQVSDDFRTFVFMQFTPYIGSPSVDVEYSVFLTNGIIKANGQALWSGFDTGYLWSFETSTIIDTTPPQVKSVIPYPSATEPRNVVIAITFSEAISPLSTGYINVNDDTTPINGIFFISNSYRTIDFLTEDACGTNSCGQTIYCLPALANINVLLNAAPVPSFLGVTDMAVNSLDGNKDGTAEGPESVTGKSPYNENSPDAIAQGDDYTWSFSTTDEIDITAPQILSINPDISGSNVDVSEIPSALFDKQMMSSSATKNSPQGFGSVALYADPSDNDVFYWLNTDNDGDLRQGTVYIKHNTFVEASSYIPEFNSGLKDIYQNCFTPDGVGGGGPNCTPNPPTEPYCCNDEPSSISCEP